MSYKRQQDKENSRTSLNISEFSGLNTNTGKTDQPAYYHFGSDFDVHDKKLELRNGERKNSLNGFYNSIQSIKYINIAGLQLMGVIEGGILSVYPVDDVLEGIRRYYTWQELLDHYTWDDIDGKTWDDLLNGGDR